MGERLTKVIPNAKMKFFEESAHVPMLEEPELFNKTVLDFLKMGI